MALQSVFWSGCSARVWCQMVIYILLSYHWMGNKLRNLVTQLPSKLIFRLRLWWKDFSRYFWKRRLRISRGIMNLCFSKVFALSFSLVPVGGAKILTSCWKNFPETQNNQLRNDWDNPAGSFAVKWLRLRGKKFLTRWRRKFGLCKAPRYKFFND